MNMRNIFNAAVLTIIALAAPGALAQQAVPSADAAIAAAFAAAPADWKDRLTPDQTMKVCSEHKNHPPAKEADEIQKRAQAAIEYPADGKFLGDWKKGESLAQSGYGLRFSDYPPARQNGGNCYACHQLAARELSFGTIGPSLLNYGKLRDFKESEVKALYERIYNSQAVLPCSNMPRFGANKILTIDQIKDIVALLMSPDSPVNK
jgi:sulfur-oxidizing protein SoxX